MSWPLMRGNFEREDLDAAICLLSQDDPILTQSSQVEAFERAWSEWLGVKYSVFVNSGASANLLSMAVLKIRYGEGEVIVPPLTWSSDIASVMHAGLTPVFVDIDPKTLGMSVSQAILATSSRTVAIFLTHCLGYNAFDPKFLSIGRLIEDCCESHGATFNGKKCGTFGLMSNFSFYYAHHMTTIEGGMICTDDEGIYDTLRALRSHGMVRESKSRKIRNHYRVAYPTLNPDFIFAYPGYNVRSTEINAAIGLSQLKRLDESIAKRRENLGVFLTHLDPDKYRTDFATEGNSNYAFTLVQKEPCFEQADRIMHAMRSKGVEFRRGMAGGGNQLRQPYLKHLGIDPTKFPNADHVHFFGYYIGNYPGLRKDRIRCLCDLLNGA